MTSKQKVNMETQELDKLIRLLAMKTVQIIVQSRLGSQIRTYCKPFTYANDIFGIAINDVPDVLMESKKVIENGPIIKRLPLSIEISLKTAEGTTMILENWILNIIPMTSNTDDKTGYSLHNKMGMMLKSLLSITRVMPAYKISRNQDPTSHTIYYRLHIGEFDNKLLGKDFKQFRFSKINFGKNVLTMSVLYRTRMVIASHQIPVNKSLDTKNNSLKRQKKAIDLNKPMTPGAFVDTTKVKEFTDTNFVFPEEPPCSWLLELAHFKYDYEYIKIDDNNEVPTAEEAKENIDINDEVLQKEQKRAWDIKDDKNCEKYMTELNLPFATASPIGELARFYREFYNAPPLQTFEESDEIQNTPPKKECTTCESEDDDVANQIRKLENSLEEYDQIVTDVCQFSNEYI